MPQNPDWIALYEYIKIEILKYNDMKLPKYLVLRLQGMTKGQFIANKKNSINASYDYKTILITFKFCKTSILQAFESNKSNFKDEQHKLNYMMAIIDSEINNVVMRLKNAKKAEEKIVNIDLENQTNEGAEYISKSSKPISKEMGELW